MFQVFPAREAVLSATGLLLFCLDSARQMERPQRATWRGARVGLWAGLLILLNPALIVVMALWLAYVAWPNRATVHHLARFGSGFVVAAVVVCAPRTVRNS